VSFFLNNLFNEFNFLSLLGIEEKLRKQYRFNIICVEIKKKRNFHYVLCARNENCVENDCLF
jgi:hypothetical protein